MLCGTGGSDGGERVPVPDRVPVEERPRSRDEDEDETGEARGTVHETGANGEDDEDDVQLTGPGQ